jgi:site-specific recombinase XerD
VSLLDEFLSHQGRDRGRSANTIRTYRSVLARIPGLETATREDIEAWWRTRLHLAPASRNVELSAVREFYKWCRRWEHRDDDPCARIDPPKKPVRVSRFVGKSDLADLLAQLPDDLRRAVALGAYGGLRVSEAAALDWSDVDVESRRIIVRGKGDKERHVGLSTVLLDHLLPEAGGNVVRGGGKAFSGHTLQQKVNKAIRGAGVDATFHKLRHRYGYKSAEAGIAPTSIARAMGHSSLSTTMGYIAAVDSDLDLIAEAVTR